MTTQTVDAQALLTHQDIFAFFGISDDDLPTSNTYGMSLRGRLNTNVTATQQKASKRTSQGWQDEATQTMSHYMHIPFVEQTSAKTANDALTLLETAVQTQDITKFQTLIQAVPWAMFTPPDLLDVIRMALSLDAPLLARRLAEQARQQYPNHREINKFAHVLATPTVKPIEPAPQIDVRANKEWLTVNRETYRGKWVAIHNGSLIAASLTLSDLTAEVDDVKGKGILITKVS